MIYKKTLKENRMLIKIECLKVMNEKKKGFS